MGQACKFQAQMSLDKSSLSLAWGLTQPYRWVEPAKPELRKGSNEKKVFLSRTFFPTLESLDNK